MTSTHRLLSILAATLVASASARAQAPGTLRLARVFGSGMVVQRGEPIPVWGWAAPGAEVSVSLGGHLARDTAGADGAWRVTIPTMGPGGPHGLSVRSRSDVISLDSVYVGDVWVASGQSNMVLTVKSTFDAQRAIAEANDPLLRIFTVPNTWSETPEADLAGGQWEAATGENLRDHSAVAYWFAKDVRAATGVPVGVVVTAWGGANVETWTSGPAQSLDEDGMRRVLAVERAREDSLRAAFLQRLGPMPEGDRGMSVDVATWADPALDDGEWETLAVPTVWERQGWGGLDGVAWYRTAFTLTAGEAAGPVTVGVGRIDDIDVTWVNGVEVGRTDGYDRTRAYTLPAGAARAGRNVLAVRVQDGGGDGGIYGPPEELFLRTSAGTRALDARWRFRVGRVTLRMDGQRINKIPSVLYNRMLHPLLGLPVTGILWYQGESNANNVAQAAEYRDRFSTLIRSWRAEWGRGDIPFLWAQLPNYGPVDSVPPSQAGWATLRESQTAALSLPRTAQAVIIDVGEAGDLHPRNKADVGKRLALLARRLVYGDTATEAWGPAMRSVAFADGRATVELAHAEGLHSVDGAEPGGFAVAGADRRWVWANARIEGDRVVVWSDAVPNPVAVRYAWTNSPAGPGLWNAAGLPAAPFRTDDW